MLTHIHAADGLRGDLAVRKQVGKRMTIMRSAVPSSVIIRESASGN